MRPSLLDRRQFLGIASATALGSMLPRPAHAQGRPAAAAGRPNVLFIAVDDLRPELGCYGKGYMHTPNFDRLAARGTVFERAYCQQAVCSPSRTSVMTGCRPDTTGVYNLSDHFRDHIPDVVTLGQHFKQHGYRVQGMGKIYHGRLNDAPTWTEPFDDVWPVDGRGYPGYYLESSWAAREAWKKERGKRNANGPAFEASDSPDDAHHDGVLAQRAVAAIEAGVADDRPFFLAVGFIKPHLPFVCPQQYWDLYDPDAIVLPASFNPPLPSDEQVPTWARNAWYGELAAYAGKPREHPLPEDYARTLIHGYRACTSFIDAQVGKLLDALEARGVAENTLIVLWGDHGWHLGDHGQWCKHDNFETATHAPLLIAAPGSAGGQATAALSEFVDIYPTLADLAGLPIPVHCEGVSLRPVLQDPARRVKDAALSQYPKKGPNGEATMGYSMRTDRYRFNEWRNRTTDEVLLHELYDHRSDPEETVNLAAMPEHVSLVDAMSRELAAKWPASNASALGGRSAR